MSSHEKCRRYAQADYQSGRHQRRWKDTVRRWVLSSAVEGGKNVHWWLNCVFHLEFRVFVETAERQLLQLFRSIDRDKDGRLNKQELHTAFQRAGLSVPMRRLSGFFNEMDMNHDGFVSFDEWRYVILQLHCAQLSSGLCRKPQEPPFSEIVPSTEALRSQKANSLFLTRDHQQLRESLGANS